MRFAHAFLLLVLLHVWAVIAADAMQSTPQKKPANESKFDQSVFDERILRDAKLPVDGPSLLQYFRDRTVKQRDPQRLQLLVQQLGDARFEIREKAYAELLTLGNIALAPLREVATHPNFELRLRAAELRKRIEERAESVVQSAAARLIGRRQPQGAAEVLLNYLPLETDDDVVEEVCAALKNVSIRDDKPEQVVISALADKAEVKRGAAGASLIAASAKEHFPAVRELLKDASAAVRSRVARAFVVHAADKDALAVLIDCLKVLPADKSWQTEEVLRRIASTNAPTVSLGTDQRGRDECFVAWTKWWTINRANIDLTKVDFENAWLGYTLIVYQGQLKPGQSVSSWVEELDGASKVRWRFEVPMLCVGAEIIGWNRVLIVERNSSRVTERDFKGNIRWQQSVPGSILSAQRLANGNTFVGMQTGLAEYDPLGTVVYALDKQAFYRAAKLRNRDVVVISSKGELARFESKTNKILDSYKVGPIGNIFGNIEELPNGNLLIPLYVPKRVFEYGGNGKEVWSLEPKDFPSSAVRLPNGNTLVALMSRRRIVEYDREGREVWAHDTDGITYVARKR